MQTFLPYPDFKESLECLDRARLGKQRVEAKQIIDIINQIKRLDGIGRGKISWANHPAVIMWEKNLDALIVYYNTSLLIWASKGYKNEKLKFIPVSFSKFQQPWWLGNESFHLSHQSNLISKKPAFYCPKFPGISSGRPYLWPKIINGKQKLVVI